jgi:hypothetical protein
MLTNATAAVINGLNGETNAQSDAQNAGHRIGIHQGESGESIKELQ